VFRSVIGGDGVDNDEPNIVALDRDGELIVEDMVLGLEVHGVDG
jgi:hypothetical protein